MTEWAETMGRVSNRIRVLACVAIGCWSLLLAQRYWSVWPIDLTAPYFAARFAALGMSDQVYASTPDFFGYGVPRAWAEMAAQLGHKGEVLARYVYPPLWAELLAPLAARSSPLAFFHAALIVNIALVVGSIAFALRLAPAGTLGLGPSSRALVTVALLAPSLALALALELGQPQVLVVFLILAFLAAGQGHRPYIAGILLALAAAIKLTPALLALVFVANRDWRGLGAFIVAGGAFVAFSFGLAGLELHRTFLDRLARIDHVIVLSSVNHTVEALFWQGQAYWQGLAPDLTNAFHVVDEPVWIGLATFTLRLILIGAAFWACRGLDKGRRGILLSVLLYLVGGLTAPLGWAHAALLPLILLPALVASLPRPAAWIALATAGTLMSQPVFDLAFAAVDPLRYTLPLGVVTQLALFALVLTVAGREGRN